MAYYTHTAAIGLLSNFLSIITAVYLCFFFEKAKVVQYRYVLDLFLFNIRYRIKFLNFSPDIGLLFLEPILYHFGLD